MGSRDWYKTSISWASKEEFLVEKKVEKVGVCGVSTGMRARYKSASRGAKAGYLGDWWWGEVDSKVRHFPKHSLAGSQTIILNRLG